MASEAMGYVETPDSTIYYEKTGASSGGPLFILNGGPGSVWTELGRNRPVICYDQRGTGRSSVVKKGDACTLANQLADLEALRANLGYDQVDVLGHSWGGFLGMAYTARHSERVRRLILVGSAAPRLEDTLFLFKDIFPETFER